MSPATTATTARVIATCARCGVTVAAADRAGLAKMCCGLYLRPQRVRGHLAPAVPCDSRCTHAKGATCSCACGGSFHGTGWERA